ncbi:MAG: nuclear transport factor 2 family protein [Pseudomonadota bacterium]
MGQSQDKPKLIEAYLSSFKGGTPDHVASHVTEGFVNEHLGLLGNGCVGREKYKERLHGFLSSFEELSYQIDDIVADDERGAARYEMTFRQSGKPFSVKGVMWFEFEGTLISKRIDCWDGLHYLQQAETSSSDIADLLTPSEASSDT